MGRKRSARPAIWRSADEAFWAAVESLRYHPIYSPLMYRIEIVREAGNLCPPGGWAVVTSNGYVHVHPYRRADASVWSHVLGHCMLHLGFGHIQQRSHAREWNVACDLFVDHFWQDSRSGALPMGEFDTDGLPVRSEERLYELFCEQGIPPHLQETGTAGRGNNDMLVELLDDNRRDIDWRALFGRGLAIAASDAVNVVVGNESQLGPDAAASTPGQRARQWFLTHFPLLGALAATFQIIEDPLVCIRLGISVAAVDAESQEIFLNPAAGLDDQECQFVMAHELLHVGLVHHMRRQGRDPFLWNVACDYVINGWLIELGMEAPEIGLLHDPLLKGESAESIYGRMATDMRRYRKLATLRGVGLGDMLDRGFSGRGVRSDGVSLDDFYRDCMAQGLLWHQESNRGYLPAGLIEEIRALSQPPVPWDVELAEWFDEHFPPVEKVRTYARPSRRQSSTPDIPRPRWTPPFDGATGRTFGVVLDTSGSMDRALLARALGAIASYSMSRDVPAARVVFCDADAYDQGYMAPEDIADRVQVKGRGGTVLQPAIDLLERTDDFPKNGPILIITDGYCDRLHIRREHAFLLPKGNHLPFVPIGKVFRIE